MIGGTMLLCAVGAMVLLATWSLARDEDPDAVPRDGLLALRSVRGTSRRPAAKTRQRRSVRRPSSAQVPRQLDFDADEMAEIAAEAEAGLPDFVRSARSDY